MALCYYKILGLTNTASGEEVKKSYKRLALQYHPDKNSSPEAPQRFREVNTAYTVLSDPDLRKRYDSGRLTNDDLLQYADLDPFTTFEKVIGAAALGTVIVGGLIGISMLIGKFLGTVTVNEDDSDSD